MRFSFIVRAMLMIVAVTALTDLALSWIWAKFGEWELLWRFEHYVGSWDEVALELVHNQLWATPFLLTVFAYEARTRCHVEHGGIRSSTLIGMLNASVLFMAVHLIKGSEVLLAAVIALAFLFVIEMGLRFEQRERLRLSLQTLLVSVLLANCLWLLNIHWDSWYLEREWRIDAGIAETVCRPNGRQILVACADGQVLELDIENGARRSIFPAIEPNGVPIMIATFSPNQRYICTGQYYPQVWNIENRMELPISKGIRSEFVAFSPDSGLIAFCGEQTCVWSLIDSQKVYSDEPCDCAEFSPDSQTILTLHSDVTELHNLRTHEMRLRVAPEATVLSVRFSCDGRHLELDERTRDQTSEPVTQKVTYNSSTGERVGLRAVAKTESDLFGTENGHRMFKRHFATRIEDVNWGTDWILADANTGTELATLKSLDKIIIINGFETPICNNQVFFLPNGYQVVGAQCAGDQKPCVRVWRQRRPERWWGLAWLPECWLSLVFSGLFVWTLRRDRRLH